MGEAFLGLLAWEQEEHSLFYVRLPLYIIWPHAGKRMLPTEQESFLWNFGASCLDMHISLVVAACVHKPSQLRQVYEEQNKFYK